MSEKPNVVATADDFRQAAEAERRRRAERVVLPKSGLVVLLARPSTRWFLFHQRLPMSLAARADGPGQHRAALPTAQEARELAQWVVALVEKTVLEPRLSLHPAENEISPDWLPQEDVDFIIRYAVGEVAPLTPGPSPFGRGERGEGGDLAPFRRGRPDSSVSAGGGDVSSVAVATAEHGSDEFPN
jgi:hypothetical protein